MQYLLMLYSQQDQWPKMSPAQQQEAMAAYGAYTEALKKAGAHIASNRLQPTTAATTVRVANGKSQVLDGPYADTKEQLGGYYLIEAPDLDAALSWAARCPGASHGTIEVRPVWAVPAAASA
ncbi:MAG TPA: YciI family protein [Candidatus Aquilonibacter sp.]|nr:YciI family protein [Candidatus Aquilonibacter sp.]